LGSGTTGGVFAPSLIVGGGVGAVYAQVWHHFLPHLVSDPALYSLVAMAAMFGGIARAPFTSIVFLFELSRNPNALLPLVVCCIVSDGFVRLFSEESIMTGKLIKRGLIVRQEYSVPVLLRARVQEVMRKNFTVVSTDDHVQSVIRDVSPEQTGIIPVIEGNGNLVGIIEAHDLLTGIESNPQVREIMRQDYVVAHPGETVDEVSRDMVVHNVENIVVVEGNGLLKPIGVARAADILRLRRWVIEEEGFGNHPVRAKGSPPARV
jgi:CIC family chloride channel protein